MAVIVAVVVLDDADDGHLLEQFLQADRFEVLVHRHELFEGVELAQLHAVADLHHFGRQDFLQAPVFGVVRGNSADLVLRDVRDLFRELRVFPVEIFFVLESGYDPFVLFGHDALLLTAFSTVFIENVPVFAIHNHNRIRGK